MFKRDKTEKTEKQEKKIKKTKNKVKKIGKDSVSIVTINRATENSFALVKNEIYPYDKSRGNKEFFITYLPYKDILTATIEINRNTPEDEITDNIVIKTYDDLALDPNDDYKITYIESPNSSNDSRFYNVFAVNNSLLVGDLSYIAESTKYIDYVAKAPFLMSALYSRNILSPTEIDCFIYLQKDDAFLAIYQNGEYFESRPIRYNLKYIYDKFCELSGNRADEKEFFKKLSTTGIYFENNSERENVIQIFDDMFFYLGDLINSISKINNIKINNLYFCSDIGHIAGVDAFIEERLGLKSKPFDFSIALNQKNYDDITQLDILMMLSAQDYMANKNDDYNYSPFLRPPPIGQRPVGKLISLCVLAFFGAMAYPAYQYGYGLYNQKVTEQKQAEFNEKDRKRTEISNQLTSLQAKKDEKDKEIKGEEDILNRRTNLLSAMYDKKVNYPLKSRAIYDISNIINKQNGLLYKIYNKDQNLTFSIRTDSEKKMTELLNDISNSRRYSVDTELILLDENNQTVAYESNVSVEMK